MDKQGYIKKTVTIPKAINALAKRVAEHYGSNVSGLIRLLILKEARELKFSSTEQ